MRSLILLLLIVMTCGVVSAQSSRPTVTLKDINGRQFSLSEYKDKVVLLNFWATWCAPCRTEVPDLIKKQLQYRKQGLRIIGITYPPQTLSEVRQFARSQKMNYRVALGEKATKALFTDSETLPMTVVIDRDGLVTAIIEGVMYTDEFDQKVKPLLSDE